MADDIYYDMHMDDSGDYYEKSKFSKIVSLFFKSIVAIIIIATFAILFYRMWSMKEPSMSEKFIADQTTIDKAAEFKNSTTLSEYTGNGWYVDFRTFDKVVLKNHKNSKNIARLPKILPSNLNNSYKKFINFLFRILLTHSSQFCLDRSLPHRPCL